MTQDSREAIIELLFLSLYMDNHLSLAEDSVLNDALDSLGWESAKPRERFILSAFASARIAAGDPVKSEDFFIKRADLIRDAGGEGEALTWLTRVLAADGLTATEKYVLDRLQKRFYPDA